MCVTNEEGDIQKRKESLPGELDYLPASTQSLCGVVQVFVSKVFADDH